MIESNHHTALAICWGIFDARGRWAHNPYIGIPAEQQKQDNIDAGFMSTEGLRIPRQIA